VLRIDRGPGSVTVTSRFARPRALLILAGALVAGALLAGRALPVAAVALGAAAAAVLLLGGPPVRATFGRGRVRVSPPFPLGRVVDRPLAEFSVVRVETRAEARSRRAEARAGAYRRSSGGELPSWLRPPDAPGANDQLRRLVLETPAGASLAVTAWLADGDLEGARGEIAALLSGG
jgi:hypothetical protein